MPQELDIRLKRASMHFHNPPLPQVIEAALGTFALVHVASGLARGKLTLADGRVAWSLSRKSRRGAMFLLAPGARFESETVSESTEAYVFVFECGVLWADKNMARLHLALPGGETQRLEMVRPLAAQEILVLRPFTEMICKYLWNARTQGMAQKSQWFFNALLSYMFVDHAAVLAQTRENYRSGGLKRLMEREDHKVKLGDMARMLGKPERRLRRHFKEEFGTTPSKARTADTMHLALYMIENTDLRFKEIAARLGMSSANYFSAFVRRNSGMTAKALRAVAQGDQPGTPRQ